MSAFSNAFAAANENWFGINELKRKASTVKNMIFEKADRLAESAVKLIRVEDNDLKSMAAAIPSPAYLVLGAHPSEGREYQSNEHYYTLNMEGESAPRFILTDLSKKIETDKLAKIFKRKFDIILFDCSVLHFVLQSPETLKTLLRNVLQMMKPGGTLFIDKTFKRYAVQRGITLTQFEEYKRIEDEKYMNVIRELNMPFHIQTVAQTMIENEVVQNVYEYPQSYNCFTPESKLIVIEIPAVGGKHKSRCHRKYKRNTTRRRRH